MRLTSAEFRFMDLLWEREPVSSGELVAVCDQKFGWKEIDDLHLHQTAAGKRRNRQ